MGLLVGWCTLPSIPRREGGRTRLPELGAVGFWDQQSICCLSAQCRRSWVSWVTSGHPSPVVRGFPAAGSLLPDHMLYSNWGPCLKTQIRNPTAS